MKQLPILLYFLAFGHIQIYSQISVLGSATPSSDWYTDYNMTQDLQNPDLWKISIQLFANEIKFRKDGDWVENWGGAAFPTGTGIIGGPNIAIGTPGNYQISFNTSTLAYSFVPGEVGSVGIGTETPHGSAILDIVSTSKGLLIPRMTSEQMNGIQGPAEGLLIFDKQINALCAFMNGQWKVISGLPDGDPDDYLQLTAEGPVWTSLLDSSLIPHPDLNGNFGLPIGPNPGDFVISANKGYIIDRDLGNLTVLDLSNPENPSLLGSKVIGQKPIAIAISGNFAFVVDEDENFFKCIDVTDPVNMITRDSVATGDAPSGVLIRDNYVLVVDRASDDIKVVDFSDPDNLNIIYVSPIQFNDALQIKGYKNYAFINDGGYLKIFDISDPTLPVLITSFSLPGYSSARISNIVDDIIQTTAFGPNPNDFVRWFDVSDLQNIVLLKQYSKGTFPINGIMSKNISVMQNNGSGNLAYLYDIKNPSNPILTDSVGFSSVAKFQISGNYLMGASVNSFKSVRLSTPQSIGIDVNGQFTKTVIPEVPVDPDEDPTNELNTGAILSGNTLEISDAGGTINVDLTPIIGSSVWAQNGNDISYNLGNVSTTKSLLGGGLTLQSFAGGTADIPGSSFGSKIIGPNSSHIVMDILGNDVSDGFYVRFPTVLGSFPTVDKVAFMVNYNGTGIGTNAPVSKLTLQGSSGSEVADFSILGNDALVMLGKNSDGPHGFAFGDDGGEGIQLVYRTISNKIIFEKGNDFSDKQDMFSIDYDNLDTYIAGSLGIGTTIQANGYMLSVGGKIIGTELKISNVTSWPDYVFKPNYKLRSLSEIEDYVQNFGHLPNIPKAAEVEAEGLMVGDMQKKMMEKIEELTLYLIEQDKAIKKLEEEVHLLKSKEH